MIYGLYSSAAGAIAESARHDVIANNIANISTPGFKADLAVFMERSPESVEGSLGAYATEADGMGGGLFVSDTYTRHLQGPIEVTDNEFDLAIDGKGYFAVTDGRDTLYTRAGAFSRDDQGRLVTPDGSHFLADASGRAITLPLSGEIKVARDGTISANGEPFGAVGIYGFRDERRLAKAGSNLYDASATARIEATGRIEQGALESSAVSPAEEMANMILAMRGYEANMKMIKMQDESLSDLMTVGTVNV